MEHLTNTSVVFRVDASLAIGAGHVMRCLTLARALRKQGAICHFLCRTLEGDLVDVLREAGFTVHLLSTPTSAAVPSISWQEDAAQTRALLETLKPDWLVVDHYDLDAQWQSAALCLKTRCLVIDDLADRSHNADVLLDQNFGRRAEDYADKVASSCTLLIGPAFSLIRPDFAQQRAVTLMQRKDRTLKTILVSLGGVDLTDATSSVLETLNKTPNAERLNVCVVIGRHAPALNKVRALVEQMRFSAEVLVDVQDMHVWMAKADLAIGAVGGTTWERACLGLPCLMLSVASNQEPAARALDAAGVAEWLGVREDIDWPDRLLRALARFENHEVLAQASAQCADLCDGDGAARVLTRLMDAPVTYRAAYLEDARRIWEWRHSDGAHLFNKTPAIIPYEDHYNWFEATFLKEDIRFVVLTKAGAPLGYVRLDRITGNEADVSLCLAGPERGQGLGREALRIAEEIAVELKLDALRAQVHPNNSASLKLFETMGYQATGSDDAFRRFRLQLIA